MSLLGNINTLNSWANTCRLTLYNLEDDLDWRVVSSYNLSKNGGIGWIAYYNRQVLDELIEAMQYFVYGHSASSNYVVWFNVHWGLYYQESEITWRAICQAWIKDDFEGRAWTIGIIDRMRQKIWDEPFDLTWAATPEKKEI